MKPGCVESFRQDLGDKAASHKQVSFDDVVDCVHVPWIDESQGCSVEPGSPAPAGVGVGDHHKVGVEGLQCVFPAPAGAIKTCLDSVSVHGNEGQTDDLAVGVGRQVVTHDDAICCDLDGLDCVGELTEFKVQGDEYVPGDGSSGDDFFKGLAFDEGFDACESKALGLRRWIEKEHLLLKHEPPESEDRCMREGFLCNAVSALFDLQDKAAAQVPEEVEYSLLPDCEVLSSHTVPLQEVYKHFHLWRNAAEQELKSLVEDKGAFKRASLDDLKRLEAKGTRVITVPGKAIFTRKSGGRFKCRIVICGNFVPPGTATGKDTTTPGQEEASLYAAGCEVAHVRQIAARAAKVGGEGFLLDIKTAFLNSFDPVNPRTAPPPTLTDNPSEIIAVRPPRILVVHGLAERGEYYLCLRAVYGLPQSPRDWSITRDIAISDMKIVVSSAEVGPEKAVAQDAPPKELAGKTLVLKASAADSQVWAVRALPVGGDQSVVGPALAWVAVYVDDVLIMGPLWLVKAVVEKFQATWEVGSVQRIPGFGSGFASFFGIEFAWKGDKLVLGQQGYIKDLRTRYPQIKLQVTPLPPGTIEIPELPVEERDIKALRACQASLGEALWVAMRTRPDLMFGVSRLASEMSKNPVATLPYIEHLLGYLFHTVGVVLEYGPKSPSHGEPGSTLTPSGTHVLEVQTDAGFAPAAGRSQECAIVYQEGALIAWISSKQPFTAQSTAEAELLSTMTGFHLGRSHQFFSELCNAAVSLAVLNDNQACLQIIRVENASWRTRHLRIRAAGLKEQYLSGQVAVGFVAGAKNGADLGTKSVPAHRLRELLSILGLSSLGDPEQGSRPHVNQSSIAVRSKTLASVVLLLCATEAETASSKVASEGSWEFSIFIAMVVVCSIAVWEALKWIIGKVSRIVYRFVRAWNEIEEPEAEQDALSEAQPDHEDDLRDLPNLEIPQPPPDPNNYEDPAPPAPPVGLVQGPVQFAQQAAPAGILRYVDDEVPWDGVGDQFRAAREREREALEQAGVFGEGMRNRNRGQRIYEEEPDFEAPPAPPRPDHGNGHRVPVPVRDFNEVREEANRRIQRAQNLAFQGPLNPHPGWPLLYQQPQGPLPGTRDHYQYRPEERPRVLIRWHLSARIRLFNPSDSRLPEGIGQSSLTGRRRTFLVFPSGETEVRDDHFRFNPDRTPINTAWRGRTELEVHGN